MVPSSCPAYGFDPDLCDACQNPLLATSPKHHADVQVPGGWTLDAGGRLLCPAHAPKSRFLPCRNVAPTTGDWRVEDARSGGWSFRLLVRGVTRRTALKFARDCGCYEPCTATRVG